MNGFITGEPQLNAAIYKRDVCNVCLNCEHAKCVNTIEGCAAFKAAMKANSRHYRKGRRRRANGNDGKDEDCVG